MLMLLGGCARTNDIYIYKHSAVSSIVVPDFPMPNAKIADEVESQAIAKKAPQLFNWIKSLMVFEKKFSIFRKNYVV